MAAAGAALMTRLSWCSSDDRRAAVVASQCLQKGHKQAYLLIGEGTVELRGRHAAYGLFERRGAAIVEVGRRRRDIAQTRYTHDLWSRADQLPKHALTLEQIAADVDALVAG